MPVGSLMVAKTIITKQWHPVFFREGHSQNESSSIVTLMLQTLIFLALQGGHVFFVHPTWSSAVQAAKSGRIRGCCHGEVTQHGV